MWYFSTAFSYHLAPSFYFDAKEQDTEMVGTVETCVYTGEGEVADKVSDVNMLIKGKITERS